MLPQLCAIDNGFGDTKFKTDEIMSKFRSKAQETTDDITGQTIEMDGIKYKFGAGQDDIDLQKTHKEVHRICTYAALVQTMKEDAKEFRLVIGLPLMQYKNEQQRDEFRKYIARPGLIIVRLNGQPKRFIIRDSMVFAQGAAALYSDTGKLPELKKSLNAIIDFGSITVNGLICEGLNPIPESMFTVNLGTMILTSRVTTAINTRHGMNVQDYETPYLFSCSPKHLEQTILETTEGHFEDIIKVMRKKNWSLETLKILGIGGGFLMTKSMTKRYFGNLEIAPNPVYANVLGMYNIGKVVWK
jgi:hypothetical protein